MAASAVTWICDMMARIAAASVIASHGSRRQRRKIACSGKIAGGNILAAAGSKIAA
jgi:hypothetical protein